MIVCMGASLTIILGIYLSQMSEVWSVTASTDISRLGAQVVNGISFIGVGTIIITGRQRVKGITTAAGLWASGCMGLAIGAGFYFAAVVSCAFILITVAFLSRIERALFANTRRMELYVELTGREYLSSLVDLLRNNDIEIRDIDIFSSSVGTSENSVNLSLKLPSKINHYEISVLIATHENVVSVEEV